MLSLKHYVAVGREASFTSGTSQRNLDSRGTASRNSRRSSISKRGGLAEATARQSDTDVDHMKKVDDWQEMSLPSLAESPVNDLTIKPPERQPMFVEVQALTKGQVFVSVLLWQSFLLLFNKRKKMGIQHRMHIFKHFSVKMDTVEERHQKPVLDNNDIYNCHWHFVCLSG